MQALQGLGASELLMLAGELRSGRLQPPYGSLQLQRWMDGIHSNLVAADLQVLVEEGFTSRQIARLLESLNAGRKQGETSLDRYVQLVTTGPGELVGERRNTSAVVQSMFGSATQSVYVAGFAIYQGQEIFRLLAERMEQLPELNVRMFLNIGRSQSDTSAPSEIIKRFVHRFKTKEWPPGKRLPEVFYDPRALELNSANRSSFHAKCVLIDRKQLFVTSANFTEAAHERNVEIGIALDSAMIGMRVQQFLDGLVESEHLERLRLV